MYRMLIVDDEPIIVEGLADLFQNLEELPLEIYKAYDGREALDLAERLRMDIVLSDIEMPEMNGIELQRAVMRLWPRSKVVLLTGYDQFDYVQSSMREGAVDYVLKTEGDEPIVAAVRKSIELIRSEMNLDRLLAGARERMEQALPALRKEYLSELLMGEVQSPDGRSERFAELGIPLDGRRPVTIVVGRVDRWREGTADSDKPLGMFSINNIAEELLSERFRMLHLVGEHNRLIWLMQPKERSERTAAATTEESEGGGDPYTYLLGTMESVQGACRQYLKLSCSFVISRRAYEWEQLPQKFDRLSLLFERGLGLGTDMLISDERMFAGGRQQVRTKVKRVRLLDNYLAQKEKAKFYGEYEEIMRAVGEPEAIQTGMSLEIFYDLTAIFISHLNRLELLPIMSERMNVGKLFSIREHGSWQEVTAFFRELSVLLFDSMNLENEQETSEVVSMIRDFVGEHLGEELSLTRLADHVYLTPFYLSRLFKQKTGSSITDYITEVRVAKATELLSETPMKIYEVSLCVGFESSAYFTKFFKKVTGLTPQEFRDSTKKI